MQSWDDIRRIALALPDTEESSSYGRPALKVNGRAFVSESREEGAIYLPRPQEEVDLLLRARPDVYFQTSHYEGWGVLARLDATDEEELTVAIEDSYAFQRDKKPVRPRAARTRRGSR
jgi:hypothetical protein